MKIPRFNFYRKLLLGYLLIFLCISHVSVAFAETGPLSSQEPVDVLVKYSGPEQSIKDFLCAPSDSNLGVSLYDCISRLYRAGIAIGSLALIFFVVIAGYFYILGGESSKAKGKSIIVGALTGMGLILLSYTLLRFISPDLVKFKPIQPPIFESVNLPSCEEIGFTSNCIISNGPAKGQVYSGAGAFNGDWNESIDKYAKQYGLDGCIAKVVVKKESGSGNPKAIGHDHTVPPRVKWSGSGSGKKASDSNSGDPFKENESPKFGLDWSFSHGIGLTQVTIFPYTSGTWPDANTPARKESELIPGGSGSTWLYPKDLLNPDFSVGLTVRKMVAELKKHNNDLKAAFKAYNGSGSMAENYANDAMQIYNSKCKN